MTEIKVSPEFKAQTTRAIFSIFIFMLTYIVMLMLAIGLTGVCIYGGIMLIIARPMFFTLALGIGLASLGVLVLFFLLKFMFTSNKVDRSHLTEIQRQDEPELFSLIDEIVEKVDTDFPKSVYLSSDVNASVFYDSNFWSMFLPIKKNLQIGLALVNSVSRSEIKAILSHEFGHFSQKSMKVGSYVYNVNQVIYNLLYENEAYDKLITGWGNVSSYFSIVVMGAIKIIDGIKWVLRQMYTLVNKSYMALSREMEFHADEIAANVTGYEPLKTALLRIPFSQHSFNNVISFYEGKIENNLRTENIFRDQAFVTHFLAADSNIVIKNNLPQITEKELHKFNKSKLVIKDQWSSHPSTEDRIHRLEKTGLSAHDVNVASANTYFKDIEKTQRAITSKMFKGVKFSGQITALSADAFEQSFENQFMANTFPKQYNGYYDVKNPLSFEIETIHRGCDECTMASLFSNEVVDQVYANMALQSDIDQLKQIFDTKSKVKTFDYDGTKYSRKDCSQLISKLESQYAYLYDKIAANDINIYKFFKQLENKHGQEKLLDQYYGAFFNYSQSFDEKYKIYLDLASGLEFISHTTPFDVIRANLTTIENLEITFKQNIQEIMQYPDLQDEITPEIAANFNMYLSKKWVYFGVEKYFEENLELLFQSMHNYAYLMSRGFFLIKKKLLIYQINLTD